MDFNEAYYTTSEFGLKGYSDRELFTKRAEWLNSLGYKHITILGCGYGFTVKHLIDDFNFINVIGIDKSKWAVSKSHELGLQDHVIQSDILLYNFFNTELIISWSVLDTLSSEAEALSIANYLRLFNKTQIHIMSMSDGKGSPYSEWGYHIRPYSYWRSLFPNAYLVCWECRKVYTPNDREPMSIVIDSRKVAV